jgi:hypothetical protein
MFILVPLALLVTACSKEKSLEFNPNDPNTGGTGGGGTGGGDNLGYYIKCKIGGTDKVFNVAATATKDASSGQTLTMISGASSTDPATLEAFSILITSNGDLANGTYKVDNLSGAYTMLATFAPPGGTSAFVTVTGMVFGNPFKVNITSVSSTEIAGTFGGDIYEIDLNDPNPPVNPPSKSVTEGEFRVKFE